jgi:glutamine synthetase
VPALPFLDRGDKPLTARLLADGGAVDPGTVFDLAKAHDATMVDLKFTDLPGTWQHMGMALGTLEEESFSEGIGFDGSSIAGSRRSTSPTCC